jgi:hypothetical protein
VAADADELLVQLMVLLAISMAPGRERNTYQLNVPLQPGLGLELIATNTASFAMHVRADDLVVRKSIAIFKVFVAFAAVFVVVGVLLVASHRLFRIERLVADLERALDALEYCWHRVQLMAWNVGRARILSVWTTLQSRQCVVQEGLAKVTESPLSKSAEVCCRASLFTVTKICRGRSAAKPARAKNLVVGEGESPSSQFSSRWKQAAMIDLVGVVS